MKFNELLLESKFSVWICQNSFRGQLGDTKWLMLWRCSLRNTTVIKCGSEKGVNDRGKPVFWFGFGFLFVFF